MGVKHTQHADRRIVSTCDVQSTTNGANGHDSRTPITLPCLRLPTQSQALRWCCFISASAHTLSTRINTHPHTRHTAIFAFTDAIPGAEIGAAFQDLSLPGCSLVSEVDLVVFPGLRGTVVTNSRAVLAGDPGARWLGLVCGVSAVCDRWCV